MGAPKYSRSHKVTWEDPAAARALMAELTGLEIMERVRDGRLAEPPMARLIDFRCVAVKPGEVVLELQPHEALENYMGMLHGAAAATLLDTAMGGAFHTLLPAGVAYATLELKLTYLRALTARSGPVRATGRVLKQGRQVAYVEGSVRDNRDELCVHAVGNFILIEPSAR